ncbi:hypothetical protein AMS68_007098 [Peltaster fructicola]|uniref:Uncharacterized protein n=1 Tax=Peltaster fructicola TaxID=286661 RepID=A0A6H0Y3T6_9PEZI|nr:hypothetical protein AMS68_007098 [Peltaster fructicola]
MEFPRPDDTLDFSALDVLSTSSTPRLLQRDKQEKAANAKHDSLVPSIDDDADSNYSINMAALGSAISTINLDREQIKINSDDIGGPSDFTLNLAQYMHDQANTGEVPETPAVDRETMNATTPAVDAVQALASSQCLAAPSLPPEDDLQARMRDLQGRYEQMLECYNKHVTQIDSLTKELDQMRASRKQERQQAIDINNIIAREAKTRDELQQTQRALQVAQQRNAMLENKARKDQLEAEQRQITADLATKEMQTKLSSWKKRVAQSQAQVLVQKAVDDKPATPAAATRDDHDSQAQIIVELKRELQEKDRLHQTELAEMRSEHDGFATDFEKQATKYMSEREAHFEAAKARQQAKIVRLQAQKRGLQGENEELTQRLMTCGKELMAAWGREELGAVPADQRQKYRYMYAQRRSAQHAGSE